MVYMDSLYTKQIKIKYWRIPALMLCFFMLTACAGNTYSAIEPPFGMANIPAIIALDAVTLINTDKTLVDHMMTAATNKDCSVLKSQDGSDYCKAFPVKEAPKPPRVPHCYNTLGSVSCYYTENPYGTDTKVGTN